jgi:hypothetical protein
LKIEDNICHRAHHPPCQRTIAAGGLRDNIECATKKLKRLKDDLCLSAIICGSKFFLAPLREIFWLRFKAAPDRVLDN